MLALTIKELPDKDKDFVVEKETNQLDFLSQRTTLVS